MNKKGVAQIFIIILSLVLFSMLVIFGLKLVGETKTTAKTYNLDAFKSNIINDMSKYGKEYGSEYTKTYDVSNDFYLFCLFDKKNANESIKSKLLKNNPIAINEIESSNYNLMLMGENNLFEFFNLDGLKIEEFPYYSCKSIKSGKLTLNFKAMGSYVTIPYTSTTEHDFETETNRVTVSNSFSIYSTDNVAKIIFEDDAEIIANFDWDGKIYLKTRKSEDTSLSDEYYITPKGLFFTNTFFLIDGNQLGVKCEDAPNAIYKMDGDTLYLEACDDDSDTFIFTLDNS